MLLRPVIVAGCLLLPMSGWATAAPSRCPQLVDPAGDETPAGDPAADLLAVSLGADRSSLTIVLRYGGEQSATLAEEGHGYSVDVDTGEAGLTAQALVSASGTSYSLYRHAVSESQSGSSASGGTGLGPLTGRVDVHAHTVTMTIPFAMAKDVLRAGQRLDVSARTAVSLMTPLVAGDRFFYSSGSDQNDSPAEYRIGGRSCSADPA